MLAGNAYGWAAPGQQQPPATLTPEPSRECTFTYDVDDETTYQPDETYTYDPCANDQ